jgi:hypothetical protein
MQGGPPQGQGPAPPPAALPGWLGPVVTLTTQVGVPTVVAGVLLYFVLFRMDGYLKNMQRADDDRVKIIAAMQDSMISALDRLGTRFDTAIKENIQVNKDLAYQARLYESDPTQRRPPPPPPSEPGARAQP